MKKVRRIRIYPFFLLKHQDQWLHQMSLNGLHLVDYGLLHYTFAVGQPKDTYYFSYAILDINNGFYDISLRYPMITETYGVPRNLSCLNRNNRKARVIVEINPDIINSNKLDEYLSLVAERNRLYARYALRTLGFLIISGLLLVLSFILGWLR